MAKPSTGRSLPTRPFWRARSQSPRTMAGLTIFLSTTGSFAPVASWMNCWRFCTAPLSAADRGPMTQLDAFAEKLPGVSVLFVGEHHDDPIAHHLELVLLKRAAEQASRTIRPPGSSPRPVALALEMFERDVQDVLDEYLGGLIAEQHFK